MDLERIEESARRSPWLIEGGHLGDDLSIVLHGAWLGEGNIVFTLASDGMVLVGFHKLRQPFARLLDPPANDTGPARAFTRRCRPRRRPYEASPRSYRGLSRVRCSIHGAEATDAEPG
jgi:hypothetical protein